MKNLARNLLKKIVKIELVEKLILKLVDIYWIDLTYMYFAQHGILKFQNSHVSGEYYVLHKVLPKIFKNEKLIAFDVGANIGNYSIDLITNIEVSQLYCFEPNPKAFQKMEHAVSGFKNVTALNFGFGEKEDSLNIHVYDHDDETEHASIYKEVLNDLHLIKDTSSVKINLTTLDNFCEKQKIERIHFLKIDTEGHELFVLKGAKRLLSENRIDVIQFEFNEMNVISRVFLKDFYDILTDYNIFRLDSNRLIPLFVYQSKNEVFQYHNYLAVHKKLKFNNV